MSSSRMDMAEMENVALPSAFSSIHECATYTNGLAKFYESSFEEGKTVHTAQTTEAIKSLKEALELVATNITNVTTTLSSYIDCQMDEVDHVNNKMNQLKHRLLMNQKAQEQSVIETMQVPTKVVHPKSNLSTYKITNEMSKQVAPTSYQYESIREGLKKLDSQAQSDSIQRKLHSFRQATNDTTKKVSIVLDLLSPVSNMEQTRSNTINSRLTSIEESADAIKQNTIS